MYHAIYILIIAVSIYLLYLQYQHRKKPLLIWGLFRQTIFALFLFFAPFIILLGYHASPEFSQLTNTLRITECIVSFSMFLVSLLALCNTIIKINNKIN